MHYYRSVMIAGLLLCMTDVFAGQKEFDDCMLKHLKGARLDVATHEIKQACYENYQNPTFISDSKRAYNDCILKHLPGVESLQAVLEIKGACYRKYR